MFFLHHIAPNPDLALGFLAPKSPYLLLPSVSALGLGVTSQPGIGTKKNFLMLCWLGRLFTKQVSTSSIPLRLTAKGKSRPLLAGVFREAEDIDAAVRILQEDIEMSKGPESDGEPRELVV
jgi:hypothetical protein